jgi:hypothetical protein
MQDSAHSAISVEIARPSRRDEGGGARSIACHQAAHAAAPDAGTSATESPEWTGLDGGAIGRFKVSVLALLLLVILLEFRSGPF